MGRTIKNQNTRRPKPVEKIQLSEKHIHLRVFLVILLLAVAAVSFTYALTSLSLIHILKQTLDPSKEKAKIKETAAEIKKLDAEIKALEKATEQKIREHKNSVAHDTACLLYTS